MCGIVGYIGRQPAAPILLRALKQLEYRGYDSAGMAVTDGKIKVIGSPADLKASLGDGSKLSDVFLHYTGKKFEERGGAGPAAPGFRPGRRGFPHRGGGLGRRRGGV